MCRWVLHLVLFLLLPGCVGPQTVALDSSFDNRNVESPGGIACDIYVNQVLDARRDKSSLGRLGLSEVAREDVLLWLTNGLRVNGFVLRGSERWADDSYPSVDIGLKMAHIRSSSTSKATNVVLVVSGHGEREYFRGDYAGVNWSNSMSEIKQSFDHALDEAIHRVEASLCSVKSDLLPH